MLTTPAFPFALFFAAIIASFIAYDRLVRHQYETAREAWDLDGHPPGMFWAPAETSRVRFWARDSAMIRFLISTPPWISRDERATELHKRLRTFWLCGMAAWIWLAALLVTGHH
jgi:hypothetical protein